MPHARLSLAAASIEGTEATASGLPLPPGIHLRWSFAKTLPYPRQGFRIDRRLRGGEFSSGSWAELATVKLPSYVAVSAADRRAAAEAEARARVYDHLAGAYLDVAGHDLAGLIDFVYPRWPHFTSRFDVASTRGGPRVTAKRIDLLALAAIEPKNALALGTYYIDSRLPPGVLVDYRVTGLWGGLVWPWISLSLARLNAAAISRARVELDSATIETDRALEVSGDLLSLRAIGDPRLPLIISFEEQARTVLLEIASNDDAAVWSARGFDHRGAAISDLTTRRSTAGRLTLHSETTDIASVEITQATPIDSTWTLRAIHYRASDATVGSPAAEVSLGLSPTPLPSLSIAGLAQSNVPVIESLRPNAPRIAGAVELTLANSACTGFHVTRRRTDGLEEKPLTGLGELAGPVPETIARLLLNGSEASVRIAGAAAFDVSLAGAGNMRNVLHVAGGYAETSVLGLDRLGESLIVGVFMYPIAWTGSGALIDHGERDSFWLGRSASGRLRFLLNGTSFQSSARIALHSWSHVQVIYDGDRIRFFINGKLDSVHTAALGVVGRGLGTRALLGAGLDGYLSTLTIARLKTVAARRTPDLIGAWALGGDYTSRPSGPPIETRGTGARFVVDHPEEAGLQSVELDGATSLAVPALSGLSGLDTEITFRAWIKPGPGQSWPTIFGNDFPRSVWLGLTPGDYRLRFRLNGAIFESIHGVRAGRWSHIAAIYDGERVRLLIDGRVDAEHAARLGPITPNTRSAFMLGSDSGAYPYRGRIANVTLQASAGGGPRPSLLATHPLIGRWPFDGDQKDNARGADGEASGAPTYISGHPFEPSARVLHLDGASYVRIARAPAIAKARDRFTLDAWVQPERRALQTIVAHGRARGFWFGLTADGKLRLSVLGRDFDSTTRLDTGDWTRVAASYDGERVKLYVQGRSPDATADVRLGSLSASDAPLSIGAQVSTAGAASAHFAGALADVRIFSQTLSPEEIDDALVEGPPPPGDHLDRSVPAGRYVYDVFGVDAFARRGSRVVSAPIEVRDRLPPPSPMGVKASFVPFKGTITGVEDRDPHDPFLNVSTDIVLPDTSLSTRVLEALARYDVLVEGIRDGRARKESFLIRTARIDSLHRLLLDIEPPPLARVTPRATDRVTIELDHHLEVQWAWTGWHQISAPDLASFLVHLREGAIDTVEAEVDTIEQTGDLFRLSAAISRAPRSADPHEWIGSACLVGAHRYQIEHAEQRGSALDMHLRYLARPVIAPERGYRVIISFPVAAELRDRPSLGDGTRTRFAAGEPPVPLRFDALTVELREGQLSIALPSSLGPGTEDELPASIVGFSFGADNYGWRALRVKSRREEGGRTILFVTDDAFHGIPSAPFPFRRTRLQLGAWLRRSLYVVNEFRAKQASLAWQIAVSAADGATPPNESALSRITCAVAVDRKRPERPLAPHVSIDAADYFGTARARVDWSHLHIASAVEVHRATDASIFEHDLAQRRARRGAYSPEHLPESTGVFDDDRDFDAWIRARHPDWHDRWPTDLFRGGEAAAEVWRDWAARFYPALEDRDVGDLAALPGHEAAFALVSTRPVSEDHFVDLLRGLATNRFFYRLRPRSASFAGSFGLGEVSAAARTQQIRPPRTPVITRLEARERSIGVDWVLQMEPNLAAYRVYRSDDREALGDLRWFEDRADPRFATIADPLIRPRRRRVALPEGVAREGVRAVHLLSEFDPSLPLHAQRAFDLRDPTAPAEDGFVALRRVADGVPLAIVTGERAFTRTGDTIPWIDRGLLPLRDYFYRVVAVDIHGNISPGSAIASGRAVDLRPPEPPEWEHAAWSDADHIDLSWFVREQGARCIVERKASTQAAWRSVSSWITEAIEDVAVDGSRWRFQTRDTSADPRISYEYRVKTVNASGNVNVAERRILVGPRE